jgi:hypothetical protein
MAAPTTAPTARPGQATSLKHTTRRAISTASFCLGLWGFFTFWMYPFGFFVANVGVALGVIALVMGYRSGEKGEQLAWWGVFFGASGAGAAMTIYRFYQLAFEGTIPTMLP